MPELVTTLEPKLSDEELAKQYRQQVLDVLNEVLLPVMDAALKDGLTIGFQLGTTPFKKNIVQMIQISKIINV